MTKEVYAMSIVSLESKKELIQDMSADNPQLYPHLAATMREDALGELWPPVKTRKEIKQQYYEYMYGKQDISKK